MSSQTSLFLGVEEVGADLFRLVKFLRPRTVAGSDRSSSEGISIYLSCLVFCYVSFDF